MRSVRTSQLARRAGNVGDLALGTKTKRREPSSRRLMNRRRYATTNYELQERHHVIEPELGVAEDLPE